MLDIAARGALCAAGAVRRIGRFGLMAGALSVLAACAGPGSGSGAKPPPAMPVVAAAPVPSRPVLEVAQLGSLKSLSSQALVARLGQPDFTRQDPPAEIWQYRGATCVLDVFLYPEDDGQMKVALAATRDRERLQAPEDACSPFAPTRAASAGS